MATRRPAVLPASQVPPHATDVRNRIMTETGRGAVVRPSLAYPGNRRQNRFLIPTIAAVVFKPGATGCPYSID